MPFFNWHSLGLRRIKVSVKSFDHYIKPFSILMWSVLAHCSLRPVQSHVHSQGHIEVS